MIDVERFHRPWGLDLLVDLGVSAPALRWLPRWAFRQLMWRVGIADRTAVSTAEVDAWLHLLRLGDNGRACARMARDKECSADKSELYLRALRSLDVPIQLIWGVADPVLRVDVYGAPAQATTHAPMHRLPAKHFLQEERFAEIGAYVARLAADAGPPSVGA